MIVCLCVCVCEKKEKKTKKTKTKKAKKSFFVGTQLFFINILYKFEY